MPAPNDPTPFHLEIPEILVQSKRIAWGISELIRIGTWCSVRGMAHPENREEWIMATENLNQGIAALHMDLQARLESPPPVVNAAVEESGHGS